MRDNAHNNRENIQGNNVQEDNCCDFISAYFLASTWLSFAFCPTQSQDKLTVSYFMTICLANMIKKYYNKALLNLYLQVVWINNATFGTLLNIWCMASLALKQIYIVWISLMKISSLNYNLYITAYCIYFMLSIYQVFHKGLAFQFCLQMWLHYLPYHTQNICIFDQHSGFAPQKFNTKSSMCLQLRQNRANGRAPRSYKKTVSTIWILMLHFSLNFYCCIHIIT